MRHESLGLVDAEPVDIGGRYAFQGCFDFIRPDVTVAQARQNFELGTYAKNARVPRPSPALAAVVVQAADAAFPVAPDKKDSMCPLKEARALLGLAIRAQEQANPRPTVTRGEGFDFGEDPEINFHGDILLEDLEAATPCATPPSDTVNSVLGSNLGAETSDSGGLPGWDAEY